jgi:hypothetical protein
MDRYEHTITIASLYNAEIRHYGGDLGADHQHFPRDHWP